MSRYYEMTVRVLGGVTKGRASDVREAANREWDFDDWDGCDDCFQSTAQGHLCGGEGAEEFSERLVLAMWRANGGPCAVEVHATCLEDVPFDTYAFGERRPPAGWEGGQE